MHMEGSNALTSVLLSFAGFDYKSKVAILLFFNNQDMQLHQVVELSITLLQYYKHRNWKPKSKLK